MENISDDCCDYETLLRENLGFFQMKIKFPVRDTKTLALVYTPGVAASCLEIQKNEEKAYTYTNKSNAILVVTDSSGFPEVIEGKEWNNMAAIPYVEAISVFYKNLANIDAYPIVLDFQKISSEEELLETINGIMPAYSGIEFYSMCPDRLQGFYDLLEKSRKELQDSKKFTSSNSYAYVDSSGKRKLDELLKSKNISLSANAIYAAVLRSALDTQNYTNLNSQVEYIVQLIKDDKLILNNKNYHLHFTDLLRVSTDNILKNRDGGEKILNNQFNLNHRELSTNYVIHKYKKFITIGEESWVETLPHGYICHKMSNDENSLLLHARYRGVIQAGSKINVRNVNELDVIFSWANIDKISQILLRNPDEANLLTCKSNLGAIVTNGTAILGLGDIGALAGLPVMEGKSVLFKLFGGTDIIPFCVNVKDNDTLIRITQRITPIFSIINLEDIKAPDCFRIENTLNNMVDYPIFHDDQHGTAVVVLAGIINSLKLRKSDIKDVKVVMNGAGAAGLSVTELLINYGLKHFIICDTEGAIYKGREKNMNDFKVKLAEMTNSNNEKGKLAEVLKGADIFIGLSAAGALSIEMIKTMNKDPIIFALANPIPEIYPNEALSAGAFIVATGRSDFPNQINNSLAFPGIFRAAVDIRARNITIEMKIAAAVAIANLVPDKELRSDFIIPGALDTNVAITVTRAVAEEGFRSKQNKDNTFTPDLIEENIHSWFTEGNLKNFQFIEKQNFQFKI